MELILDALLLSTAFAGWGALATLPWRLLGELPTPSPHGAELASLPAAPALPASDAGGSGRLLRGFRVAALPLAVTAVFAAYALADRNPDATVAAHLVPLRASLPGEVAALMATAQLMAALLVSLGGERLDRTGWRIVTAIGIGTCAAAAWAGEELRLGGGPLSSGLFMTLLIAIRMTVFLAAGDLFTPGRPRWSAAAAGAGMAVYVFLLPHDLRVQLLRLGLLLTFGAAAVLLLLARWLPPTLRRPALGTGLLLAAVALTQAAHASQDLMPLAE